MRKSDGRVSISLYANGVRQWKEFCLVSRREGYSWIIPVRLNVHWIRGGWGLQMRACSGQGKLPVQLLVCKEYIRGY